MKTILVKQCETCGTPFGKKPHESYKQYEAKRFCSLKCPWVGRKHSEETKALLRSQRLGITTEFNKGEKSHFWRGGRTKEVQILRESARYGVWRRSVYERDNYTCQECGQRGGRLNADHIKSFARFPELRFELSNGRTLCEECHKKTPTFGGLSRV